MQNMLRPFKLQSTLIILFNCKVQKLPKYSAREEEERREREKKKFFNALLRSRQQLEWPLLDNVQKNFFSETSGQSAGLFTRFRTWDHKTAKKKMKWAPFLENPQKTPIRNFQPKKGEKHKIITRKIIQGNLMTINESRVFNKTVFDLQISIHKLCFLLFPILVNLPYESLDSNKMFTFMTFQPSFGNLFFHSKGFPRGSQHIPGIRETMIY